MIVLAGAIGVGKTTYTEFLAHNLGTEAFYESVNDNPILPIFYEDQKRYAFALQIHFLNKRFKSIKKALSHNNNVLDRSIYEDALFCEINYKQGNMAKEEYDIYIELLDNMMEEIKDAPESHKKAPDLLIYLHASFDTLMERIKLRGREYEQIEGNEGLYNYYKLLYENYGRWLDEYIAKNISDVLVIDTNKIDITTEQGQETVLSLVLEKVGG